VVMGAKWYADLLRASGLRDSAMAELRRAHALDPALAITMYNIGDIYYNDGAVDSSIVWLDRSLDAAPRLVLSLVSRARIAAERNDSATTIAMLRRLQDASTRVAVPIAELERAWGRGGAAGLARLMGDAGRNPRVPGERAVWLAFAGDLEGALLAWDAAIEAGDVWAPFAASRPWFDPVRHESGFRARLERMKLPADAIDRLTR
jgi:tetratricopeptide (TPR) repeat protein